MNLPNKLSLARIILVPVCMAFLLLARIPHHYVGALIVFAAASITDMMDGRIARSRGLVSTLGKFLDPLADKMLVCSVLICFVELNIAPAVAVVVIVFREFAISGLRLMAAQKGKVLAANRWGKAKTLVTMILVCIILFVMELCEMGVLTPVTAVLPWCRGAVWFCALLTLVSVLSYFADNLDCLK